MKKGGKKKNGAVPYSWNISFYRCKEKFQPIIENYLSVVFLVRIHMLLQTEEKTETLIYRKLPTTYSYNTLTEAVNIKELYVSF